MTARAERVSAILRGVLQQAVADAGVRHVSVQGEDDAARFVRDLCVAALGADAIQPGNLQIAPDCKTALLLGTNPGADILLLGDLYYSQVAELAGSASLTPEQRALAAECGGTEALDRALSRFFDQRERWDTAVSDLSPAARARLRRALDAARFRRARLGLVPKLGPRTLGIDLYA